MHPQHMLTSFHTKPTEPAMKINPIPGIGTAESNRHLTFSASSPSALPTQHTVISWEDYMFPPITDMTHAKSHRMISTLEYRGIDTQATPASLVTALNSFPLRGIERRRMS